MQNEDGNPLATFWPYLFLLYQFGFANNCKDQNNKQLNLIGDNQGLPVPGTKEILQVTQNERKCKIFFLLCPNLGHILAIFWETHLTLLPDQGTGLPQNHLVILTVMPPLGWSLLISS